jgi:thioredoxin reductase/ferredoxin
MFTLITVAGLGSITGLSIYRHLRRVRPPAGSPGASTTKCPRCGAPLAGNADRCPGCGVPLQLFELVSAPIAEPDAEDSTDPPRALVRADLCVGCGVCVGVCPEPGALAMRNKLAVVDPALCKGHGDCVAACPLGAISLVRGSATNRVVVPDLDVNFETCVPGLYIVGELGGRSLIKNAVNEGRIAAEHVASMAARRRGRDTGPSNERIADVAIVGAGPSGLSAGLTSHRAGLDYLLLEQGAFAETVRKYPRHKVLFAEPLTIPVYGDLWISDASKESLLAIWETVVARTGLRVTTEKRVTRIVQESGVFTITAAEVTHRARAVILAMGRRGTPRRLGIPGEELPTVFYDVAEMADFAGRRVLVVGGGDSAIESTLGLANQVGTTVTLSYRSERFARLKERNRARIEAAIADGRVTAVLRSTVREIRSDLAVLDVEGSTRLLPCDDVVIRIGGEPATALLEQLGVRMVTKELASPAPGARFGSGDAA